MIDLYRIASTLALIKLKYPQIKFIIMRKKIYFKFVIVVTHSFEMIDAI